MLSREEEQRILTECAEVAKQCTELHRKHNAGDPILAEAKDALSQLRATSSQIFDQTEQLLECHGEAKDFDGVFGEMLNYANLMDKIIDGLIVAGRIVGERKS
jgi:hypothetical protein